jgi:hypothetical protein
LFTTKNVFHSTYETFIFSPLRFTIGSDYFGNPRPFNDVADIGCQEWWPTVAPTIATATEPSATTPTLATTEPSTPVETTETKGTEDQGSKSAATTLLAGALLCQAMALLFLV